MPNILLTTKLYAPPLRPDALSRTRLKERLTRGLHRKMTLISAPAGFGKTTLVRQWTADCGPSTAWLSLDEGDNDVHRFLQYLVAALQSVVPQLGQGVPDMMQAPQPVPVEAVLTGLINELSAMATPAILVLDDYHAIESAAVDEAMAFLLRCLPQQMHLVVATREDPQLPLARLRARDQLTELRAGNLRFTPDEAAGFLKRVTGLNLSAQQIAALESRTEGWIAGLQMAALSMQAHPDIAGFIESFTGSHRYVMDYLVEEVLHQQNRDIQQFMLQTSILRRMCGPLCDAVLADAAGSGQQTLERLEQANLFIVPLDSQRRWFRYHHLFAELLRQRLDRKPQSAGTTTARLHARASAWYADNGFAGEAIEHALFAEDHERAADLAELAWPAMDETLQAATWLNWVKVLPDDVVRARPVLNVDYAWALLGIGEMEAGARRLTNVESLLEDPQRPGTFPETAPGDLKVADQERYRTLQANIAFARSYIAQAGGDVDGTVRFADLALSLAAEEDHLWRGSLAGLLGCAHWTQGDLAAAHQNFNRSMQSLQQSGKIQFALAVTMGLAGVRMVQGRLGEAAEAYARAIERADAHPAPLPPIKAEMHLGLCLVHCEQGGLDTAEAHLAKSRTQGDQAAFADWPCRWHQAKARVMESHQDFDGALDQLKEARQRYLATPLPDARPVGAQMARLWIRQGRLNRTREWAAAHGLSGDDKLSYLNEFEHITLARLRLAEAAAGNGAHALKEATALLDRLQAAAQAGARIPALIEIHLLQALTHEAREHTTPALAALTEALRLAAPEGFVQPFLDEGGPLRRLLELAAGQKIERRHTARLLAAFDARQPPAHAARNALDSPPLLEPLSKRELEVLRLIAQGRSNREIGERLFLALTTVKGHNRNIFGKLQVQRRTQAVARARELGLL